jgi:hypothetical protein
VEILCSVPSKCGLIGVCQLSVSVKPTSSSATIVATPLGP